MKKKNILDYLKSNNSIFNDEPFNNIDSLILCQFFYGKIEKQINESDKKIWKVKDLYRAEYFDKMFIDDISDEENKEVMTLMAANPRFREINIKNLVVEFNEKREMQFAAVTYEIDNNTDYVCFRGTDGTMLGWKEDFNMAFMTETPSQKNAVHYIKKFYENIDNKKLYIGGHSKGGNLAVYGASLCGNQIQGNILKVFSHDGPGFRDEFFLEKGYEEIKDRIFKMVPQTSAVGMLLENQVDYKVVKSSAFSILQQHSAFTWMINEYDFEYLKERSGEGIYIDNTMHQWLMSATLREREIFVDTLFNIFNNNGIDTIRDANAIKARDIAEIIGSLDELDEESKKVFFSMIKSLIVIAIIGRKESALKRMEIGKKPLEKMLDDLNSNLFKK